MLDVLELEKKWAKYHFKKMFPLYIISFITATFFGVSTYLYTQYPDTIVNLLNKETAHKEQLTVIEVNKSIKPVQPVKPHVKQLVKTYPRNILRPSFNFIYNLEDYVINMQNAQKIATVIPEEPPKPEPKPRPKVKKSTPKKQLKQTPKPKKVAKKVDRAPIKAPVEVPQTKQAVTTDTVQTIVIGDSSPHAAQEPQQPLLQVASTITSEDELRSVIKRYNNNKNPALSLFISKKYYENGNFKESYVYAKETYKLNPNIEDGVLLYAQSSVKLGKKDDATDKLELYIKNSGSIKAKTLLNEIQKGTFK